MELGFGAYNGQVANGGIARYDLVDSGANDKSGAGLCVMITRTVRGSQRHISLYSGAVLDPFPWRYWPLTQNQRILFQHYFPHTLVFSQEPTTQTRLNGQLPA